MCKQIVIIFQTLSLIIFTSNIVKRDVFPGGGKSLTNSFVLLNLNGGVMKQVFIVFFALLFFGAAFGQSRALSRAVGPSSRNHEMAAGERMGESLGHYRHGGPGPPGNATSLPHLFKSQQS